METLAADKYLRASTAQCFHRKCWSFVPWNGLYYSKQMTFKINKKVKKEIRTTKKKRTIDRSKGTDQTRARVSIIIFQKKTFVPLFSLSRLYYLVCYIRVYIPRGQRNRNLISSDLEYAIYPSRRIILRAKMSGSLALEKIEFIDSFFHVG